MKNKAKCRNCGDVVESKHRHDFVSCKCYIKSDIKTEKALTTARKYVKNSSSAVVSDDAWHIIACAIRTHYITGFSLDGGSECKRIVGREKDAEYLDE